MINKIDDALYFISGDTLKGIKNKIVDNNAEAEKKEIKIFTVFLLNFLKIFLYKKLFFRLIIQLSLTLY
jgi:hypothetical protein